MYSWEGERAGYRAVSLSSGRNRRCCSCQTCHSRVHLEVRSLFKCIQATKWGKEKKKHGCFHDHLLLVTIWSASCEKYMCYRFIMLIFMYADGSEANTWIKTQDNSFQKKEMVPWLLFMLQNEYLRWFNFNCLIQSCRESFFLLARRSKVQS